MEAASSSDDAFRIALEEIYEDGGLTKACFKLEDGSDDMRKLTEDEHGGKGAHVYDTHADLRLYSPVCSKDLFRDLDSFATLIGQRQIAAANVHAHASAIGIEKPLPPRGG